MNHLKAEIINRRGEHPMLTDIPAMNPKGHVKVELYNDKGVFYKKEKKNLVVQDANKIVANMMSDPAKLIRVPQTDKGNVTTANSSGLYVMDLTIQHEKEVLFEQDYGSNNAANEFSLNELKGVTKVHEVKVDNTSLVVNRDVFIKDAENGVIHFKEAPKGLVTIRFNKVNNPYMKIIEGTEVVKVDGVEFERSNEPENQKYVIDSKTGKIFFNRPVQNVEVSYEYHMHYSLGFMGIGGKPDGHPNFQPVTFGQADKLLVEMKNEFKGARVPIIYPAQVEQNATELEPPIMTKPVNTELMPEYSITIVEDTINLGTAQLHYDLPNVTGNFGRPLYEFVSIINETKETEIPFENVSLIQNDASKVTIQFSDSDVEIDDVIKVQYRVKLNDLHLIYQLSQAPIVKLISVRHTAATGDGTPKTYNIVGYGLTPNQGDVWIHNPNQGTIQFSANPTGDAPPVETPGQIEVEYQVNSGTVVRFVADFPKGVPAPTIEEETEVFVVAPGQTSVVLTKHEIAKDEKTGGHFPLQITVQQSSGTITLNEGDYEIALDNKTISFNSVALQPNDTVIITYKYEKSTHDIYQVAMFDQKEGGHMFNISGIGPITKDKNTGMRVSWSVTF